MLQNVTGNKIKLPMMLLHLTPCRLVQEYILDDELFESATFSVERKININASGHALYCALSKTPPTICTTPGKMLPGGYTKAGKYKAARWTPAKTDKRAGK